MIFRWRYRNKVLHRLDFIFSSMGASRAKQILRVNYSGRWKELLNSHYDSNTSVDEAAAMTGLLCLRGVLGGVNQEDRDLALYALQTDNRASPLANHLRSIASGISLYTTSDAVRKSAEYEILGLLKGLDGEELDSFRTKLLLEDVARSLETSSPLI